ncbi:OmpA family protein [Myroides marinus]|uniref:OmpA family protein n=1 Tax=Myroides marinus TaxID=703342 RepID=UPI0007422293|nr:OmpA family protein [Myroides marinus]KUF42248.1 flagellar motor protein MotB [Myroides marinus]MDM1380383.1 OmpA family protein [Myroides marinus]MDM1387649.1 OmpA family protein [Myroides marinus]MDM1394867.1 OmpA family protein [Myroides marinus]MDM1533763.1 OmpA family protein [Myroides marinus]
MKKTTFLLASALLVMACNQKNKETDTTNTPVEQSSTNTEEPVKESTSFKIENIPYSEAEIGAFPFFTLPKGLKEMNKPLQKNFDVCYFPIEGIMTPIEGKLYKTNVTAVQGEEFSQRYFEKSLEDYLTSIGAYKVYDGEITQEEYDRYNKQDPNKGADGDIGYAGEVIKMYVIKTHKQGNIYIQYTANNAGGKLNILQEEALEQTITKITADEIVKDLTEKGKSILYINFDTEKSSVTKEGNEVVSEISTALKKDSSLKISIEGHTDNTGEANHNKKLSSERANAVMTALISQGIDKSRLVAKGLGADNPLVANDSDSNKAKNRRVELVRIK